MNLGLKITLFASLLFAALVNAKSFNDINDGQPKIKSYKESECLVMEDNKIAVESGAQAKHFSIQAKFLLHNVDGEVYVEPKVKKGFSGITFSFKKAKRANSKNSAIFSDCYKRIELEIGADVEKFNTLYIVVDDVVVYDFPLNKY